ncbi:hypothetical protein [Alkaliphilus metalliredigens]|nr:hypothetical protein [Alkaliphilus metalliredigens]
MENRKDKQNISNELELLKKDNEEMRLRLSAIELLLVDENNGRSKDPDLSNAVQGLSTQISSLIQDIDSLNDSL